MKPKVVIYVRSMDSKSKQTLDVYLPSKVARYVTPRGSRT